MMVDTGKAFGVMQLVLQVEFQHSGILWSGKVEVDGGGGGIIGESNSIAKYVVWGICIQWPLFLYNVVQTWNNSYHFMSTFIKVMLPNSSTFSARLLVVVGQVGSGCREINSQLSA